MRHITVPSRVVHWALAVLVLLILALVVLHQVQLADTAQANRDLVCDLAAWNHAQIDYYEGVIQEPVAVGIEGLIDRLLDEARVLRGELAQTCPQIEEGP